MKIPANNQVIFIKNVVAVAAYKSCRLWRWVKMPWIHYVVQPPLDPVLTCHQRYKPCRAGTNSGRPQMTSKTPLTGCQVKPPDSCTPMKLTVLGPHVLSHGRTDDQLECRLPWQSPRSIGLCGSSWYPWCCGSSEWTCLRRKLILRQEARFRK